MLNELQEFLGSQSCVTKLAMKWSERRQAPLRTESHMTGQHTRALSLIDTAGHGAGGALLWEASVHCRIKEPGLSFWMMPECPGWSHVPLGQSHPWLEALVHMERPKPPWNWNKPFSLSPHEPTKLSVTWPTGAAERWFTARNCSEMSQPLSHRVTGPLSEKQVNFWDLVRSPKRLMCFLKSTQLAKINYIVCGLSRLKTKPKF
jgi:hypothetical protein